MRTPSASVFLVAWSMFTLPSARQEQASAGADQNVPLNRLAHMPGTVTGKAGIAHVERRGRGSVPMVLLAGAPFGWSAWEGFMKRNEDRYRMFALTAAGYGGTKPPAMPTGEDADYTKRAWTEALMADLVELIEREIVAGNLGPAVVIGHHLMGDYYAVRLAYEHPELVRAVVSAAGSASQPIGSGPTDLEKRATFVRDVRAPFFRSVPQETWNAGTFPALALSKDPVRGQRLFEEEVSVPLATQIRYYLEYLTDDLEQGMPFVQAPILVLSVPPAFDPDSMLANLPQARKDQLIQRYGSLEAAKKEVISTTPWTILAAKAGTGIVRTVSIGDSGVFVMDDQPEEFDRLVAEFIAWLGGRSPASDPVDVTK